MTASHRRRGPLIAAAALALGLSAADAQAASYAPFGAEAWVTLSGTLSDGGGQAIEASKTWNSYYPGTSYGSSVYAAASLASGQLHAAAFTQAGETPVCQYGGDCDVFGGVAHAVFWDTVHFTSTDGGPLDSIELIPTSLEIDGHLQGDAQAKYRSYFGMNPDYDPEAIAWEQLGEGTYESLDSLFVPLTGGTYYVYFELWASTNTTSGYAAADFGNTLNFNWVLPEGVQAQSESGVFLTQIGTGTGVPEPATWIMMIAGFGLMGATLRNRRGGLCKSA